MWSVIGLSLYLNDTPNSLFLTAAYGMGDLETGRFESDAIVGIGVSRLIGFGFIISNSFGIEISKMDTKVDKNDRLENDFSANSVRLTLYWQFL